jgi:two-component system sensor histidine kinase RegB
VTLISATGMPIETSTPPLKPSVRTPKDRVRTQTSDAAGKKNLLLLIQLRWLAVAGQVGTIAVVYLVFGIAIPLVPMAAVILCLVALNAISLMRARQLSRVSNIQLFAELLFDVAAFTVQLYLSGGGTNPFISLYLLQVILGAILLETWSSWTIVAITSSCYLWLINAHRALVLPQHPSSFFNLHLHGMFVCFLLAAVLLVFFISRITRNLRDRDANLARLRQQAAEEDHIVRMGLLASGAAHELGTPLATLSVLLNDWQRMPSLASDPELTQDIREMQAQVARCKTIVSDILLSAGEARGEGTVRTTVNAFLDEAVVEWRASRSPSSLDYRNGFGADAPIVSDTALKHIIFNLFDNALDASPGWVRISARREDDKVIIAVDDRGPGFSPEMLTEFGQPYASTKEHMGSGVGLFLVCNVARKLGGTVAARNRGDGATVALTLPLAALSPGGRDGR